MPQVSGKNLVLQNEYFTDAAYSFETLFKKYISSETKNSKYLVLSPVYKNINLEKLCFRPTDYFSDALIEKIKKQSISIIFDCSSEGSRLIFPYFKIFKKDFLDNKLPLKDFYYLTGDPLEKDSNNYSNVYHINTLDSVINYHNYVQQKNIDFYFTCLTRKPRYWRSKLIYAMHTNFPSYTSKMLCSHPVIQSENSFMNHTGIDIDNSFLEFFIKNSPMQASLHSPLSDDMLFESVISSLPEVYNRAVFDVVLETYQEGSHEYITEKTFKPMLNMTPVIIWGTPGINTTGLKRLGFKTYEDWFDLSFDSEPDTKKRLTLLLKEINRVCKVLDNCSDLRDWQETNLAVMEYNKNLILNLLPTNVSEFTRLYKDLEKT